MRTSSGAVRVAEAMPPRLDMVSLLSRSAGVGQALPHPPATKCAHDFANAGPPAATGVPSGCFAGITSPSSREEGNDVCPNCGLLSRMPRGAEAWSKVIEDLRVAWKEGLAQRSAHYSVYTRAREFRWRCLWLCLT